MSELLKSGQTGHADRFINLAESRAKRIERYNRMSIGEKVDVYRMAVRFTVELGGSEPTTLEKNLFKFIELMMEKIKIEHCGGK